MENNLYSVYDSVSKRFTPVFFQVNDAVALRTFGNMCKDSSHDFGRNPKDYKLYRVGFFNDLSGTLANASTEHDSPVPLISGLDVVKSFDRSEQYVNSNGLV